MFEKLEVIGKALPVEIKEELAGYLDLIKDQEVREQIESAIVSSLTISRKNETAELRLVCLYAMFKCMGLEVRTSCARQCSTKFCDYVMKFFVSLDYKMFSVYNRQVMYRIDRFEGFVLDGFLAYHCSRYFDKDVFSSFIHAHSMDILFNCVNGLEVEYPAETRGKIVNYVLYYLKDRSFFRYNEDLLLNLVRALRNNGIDFFEFTDKLQSYGEDIGLAGLTIYLNNISIINKSSKTNYYNLFELDIPSMQALDAVVYAINRGVMVPDSTYKKNPDLCHEYFFWKGDNLPLEKYIKLGYVKIGQLRLIKFLLQRNYNPANFNIKPDMAARTMRRNIESRLGLLVDVDKLPSLSSAISR